MKSLHDEIGEVRALRRRARRASRRDHRPCLECKKHINLRRARVFEYLESLEAAPIHPACKKTRDHMIMQLTLCILLPPRRADGSIPDDLVKAGPALDRRTRNFMFGVDSRDLLPRLPRPRKPRRGPGFEGLFPTGAEMIEQLCALLRKALPDAVIDTEMPESPGGKWFVDVEVGPQLFAQIEYSTGEVFILSGAVLSRGAEIYLGAERVVERIVAIAGTHP